MVTVTELTTDDLRTPLPDVPMALDLLNTEWLDEVPFDVLTVRAGVELWLDSHGFDPAMAVAARGPLVRTRAAIRAASHPTEPSYAALNAVLAHGRVTVRIDDDGQPTELLTTDRPAWLPAVTAAFNLLELIRAAPDRIRSCEHPDCELWFFDSTRNGSRRWCSMADCGNRAKAKRHYQRVRSARPQR